MTYTARNTFHNTTVRFRCKSGDLWVSDAKFRRIKRKLCGMKGCECGGLRGEAGAPALVGMWDIRDNPSWLGDERLHSSHRAALLAKAPEHYGQFGWSETPGINYYWPEVTK